MGYYTPAHTIKTIFLKKGRFESEAFSTNIFQCQISYLLVELLKYTIFYYNH